MLTMAPPPLASIAGSSYFIEYITPCRLTSMTRCQSASGYSAVGWEGPPIPALFTARCRPPKRSTVAWTMRSTAAASATSSWNASVSASPSRAASACAAAPSWSAITTFAPSRARRRQMAAPIPDAPPVTIATCPSNLFMALLLWQDASMLGRGGHGHLDRDQAPPARPAGLEQVPDSVQHAAEHGLQVARLGHVGQERVVRAGTGDLEHLHGAAGVERGPAQHVQELVLGHQAGAGEGGQQAAGLDHAQGQLVHVQVLLQRGDDLVAVAGHLGRVQHHGVVLLATGGGLAQPREDVGLDELRAHVVQACIALGDLDHVLVDVDAGDLGRAAGGGVHGEAAGVAAQVEHALAGHLAREPLAVLALVGEEAGLVRTGRVGAEADAVLGDHRRLRRATPAVHRAVVEALLLLHVLLGEAVDAGAGEVHAQRLVYP